VTAAAQSSRIAKAASMDAFVPCCAERSLKMMPDQRYTAGEDRRCALASCTSLKARSSSARRSAAGVPGAIASWCAARARRHPMSWFEPESHADMASAAS